MTDYQRIEVARSDISNASLNRTPDHIELAKGEVDLSVEGFSLTTNNICYTSAAENFGYSKFFPTNDPLTMCPPAWGYARVTASQSKALNVGDLLYGYVPLAEKMRLKPMRLGPQAIFEMSAHRRPLLSAYNGYHHLPAEAAADPAHAIIHPLVATSYALFDMLAENEFFNSKQLVISSSSGKTAIGFAQLLKAAGTTPRLIGLTAAEHVAYVEDLGLYDSVLPYEEPLSASQATTTYVDLSGRMEHCLAVHEYFGAQLMHSCRAIAVDTLTNDPRNADLAGPTPVRFLASDQIEKRRKDWRPGIMEARIDKASRDMIIESESWLNITTLNSLEAARQTYEDLAIGKLDPAVGFYVDLTV